MFESAHAVDAAGDKAGAGGDARFCPDERTELSSVGAERRGDREGASPFGESEPQGESCRCCAEREREAELDAVRPSRSTAVRLDPTTVRLDARSVTVALVPSCCRRRSATAPMLLPPVSTRNAPTVSLPVLLGDVAGVGEQEAVVRRCRELLGDADVVEGNVDVLLRDAVLQAKRDGVTREQLEVVDGLCGHEHSVGL